MSCNKGKGLCLCSECTHEFLAAVPWDDRSDALRDLANKYWDERNAAPDEFDIKTANDAVKDCDRWRAKCRRLGELYRKLRVELAVVTELRDDALALIIEQAEELDRLHEERDALRSAAIDVIEYIDECRRPPAIVPFEAVQQVDESGCLERLRAAVNGGEDG